MYSDKLIEITQDAACVIKKGKEDARGFFTDNIHTCLIYIITTELETIAIHDSGQLCIKELSSFIGNHGKICSITLVYGPELNLTNKNRLPSLLSSIGYAEKPNVFISKFEVFSVAFDMEIGVVIYPNSKPESVHQIPNKSKVQTIVELNNNFIPLNSQSLPLDVQFNDGDYCNNSRLLFSLDEMLKTSSTQPKYSDINHMYLKKGHIEGLFNLPSDYF